MQSTALISVWADERVACVRLVGRANLTNSVEFKHLIHGLAAEKPRRFVLDLSRCLLMDSTFLGVMAGLRQSFQNGNPPENLCSMELYRPTERVLDMLENLGLTDYFKVTKDNGFDESVLKSIEHVPGDQDPVEVSETCLAAHKKLMEINPDNVGKFKDVTRFLEEDLKKARSRDQ